MEDRKKVDVVIPTYKPGKKFSRLLKMLQRQTWPVGKIIVMNTEKSFWNEHGFEGIKNLEVHHLTKEEFDHGETRNRGMRFSRADIVVFMTDDAVPADEHLIEALVKAFEQRGPEGEAVIMAYARQLPDKDCPLAERYTRSFNYPEESCVKTRADLEQMGIKTFFASNVCCAYDREKFWFQGGFIRRTIFNEDMIFASHLIEAGKKIAYAADAKVWHWHNYTAKDQLKRNFDLAVSQVDAGGLFTQVKSESEGIRLVKMTLKHFIKKGQFYYIPKIITQNGAKYIGYRLGKNYKKLPKKWILKISLNLWYWK